MSLKMDQKSYLSEFAGRVSFDSFERMLYSHDVGEIPLMIKPLIGNTVPDAVVQPESEAEVASLVKWASKERIAITPRGKATSGYGGTIPVKKGVVVDMRRMDKVLELHSDNSAVTVEPAITWEKLDLFLKQHGLTLRMYPSSYPSSTVGGWFAQGGAGIGSYEHGYFKNIVDKVRLALPSGEIRELSGKDLLLAADAEGTTGIITSLRLRVKALEEQWSVAISCKTAGDLKNFLESVVKSDLPLWNVMYINPRMAEFKNSSPLRMHDRHFAEEKIELPDAFIVSITYSEKDNDKIRPALKEIASETDSQFLDQKIADHLWEHRFKIMLIKRLGPSLVPTEVVLPLSALDSFTNDASVKVAQPFVKEGLILKQGSKGKPEVIILGFIPADQRKLGYNLVFALSLSMIKIAQRHGGRAYASGLYFANKASQVHGLDNVNEMRAFKKEHDPGDILNPGKIYSNGALSHIMKIAEAFDFLSRPLGNIVTTRIGERFGRSVHGIPADVLWYAYSCSQCGYCVDSCAQFYGRGWESQSPRGKWYTLRRIAEGKIAWSQKIIDNILLCTTCERCDLRCSASIPIEPSWLKLRGKLIHEKKHMTIPPFEMMEAALRAQGDIWAGYRRDRMTWFPSDLQEKHGPGRKSKAVYFAGCTSSYVEHDIGIGSVRLLDAAGVDFTCLGQKENCCGTPMLVAGKWDTFVDIMKANIAAVKETGADTVISSCPACDMMWRKVYPVWAQKAGIDYNIRTIHYSEIVAEKLRDGSFTFPENSMAPITVTWHDSCHIGRASGVYEEPREVIKAIPNVNLVEMASNREEGKCCGSVLTLLKEPDVAAGIGEIRLKEAVDAGAQNVLALCPCCQFQLRVSAEEKGIDLKVIDLSRFAAEALGFKLPDPDPEVMRQWAVFEAMIALMTPRGFANLMGTMWPELIDAMPLGMGPVMRLMGKIPGALQMMKPLFPVLFPRLLPLMMPKVMPAMLARVKQKVPMPDYMEEQMPQLMPEVMNNLMPHMIGDVVPLISEPMIRYLQGKQKTMN